ncbi:hypothetical protein ElyMa_001904900 [Elysia marginata]|uniref:Uncharacterized protein n=1 Tax=Elysia marginata TaxID=1093978 RepID=A0AAV4ETI8_9GAST|nr:hypothetical protein ElyMa_001904900 [Elysia marginata]
MSNASPLYLPNPPSMSGIDVWITYSQDSHQTHLLGILPEMAIYDLITCQVHGPIAPVFKWPVAPGDTGLMSGVVAASEAFSLICHAH